MQNPSDLSDEELVGRLRGYAGRYSNRHKGRMFLLFAEHVTELLNRYDGTRTTEFAPVLPNGLVLDHLADTDPATFDQTNLTNRTMRLARRTVTSWEYDDDTVV